MQSEEVKKWQDEEATQALSDDSTVIRRRSG